MTRVVGIIPARYGSSRFPGKSLADIGGRSMVQRVYEQASKALDEVWVATDDQRIHQHVIQFGKSVMTSDQHPSGTDRCSEALRHIPGDWDYVINIQGDEPFLDPGEIRKVGESLEEEKGGIEIATLGVELRDQEKINDPNTVKVVANLQGNALYFSRSPIPYHRNPGKTPLQHIGLYAYRCDILEQITKLPLSELEQTESLEQLRWLDHGYSIRVLKAKNVTQGIDTPEDLERAINMKLWQAS